MQLREGRSLLPGFISRCSEDEMRTSESLWDISERVLLELGLCKSRKLTVMINSLLWVQSK